MSYVPPETALSRLPVPVMAVSAPSARVVGWTSLVTACFAPQSLKERVKAPPAAAVPTTDANRAAFMMKTNVQTQSEL